MPHSRKIAGAKDLYELRVKQGSDICRLFYFAIDDVCFIALSGYVKKRQKTDAEEIERALRIQREIKEALRETD
jgi:phage-related protein